MTKTILITGAARRIGRAMAAHFAAKGWHIAAHYGHAQADALILQHDIAAKGGKITLFQSDFTQDGAAAHLFDDVVNQCGMPTILINNAARFERDDGGITEESLNAHMTVNCTAPIMLTQLMRTGKTGPRFVFNILDRVLDWSWPHLPAYVMSKLGLEEWTKRNAETFKPDLYMFGLRLGPTMRNPRESEAHFEKAIATKTATKVEDILAAIEASLENPQSRPSLVDI
ncbi:MAG: SDR family NAD(P)-dependent oxidoreductase [Alphaproteobacteria bacterium]|nr:SDR family NAD(P)-dependent oxidoreductase [Alphaproteobacteria bacterium]